MPYSTIFGDLLNLNNLKSCYYLLKYGNCEVIIYQGSGTPHKSQKRIRNNLRD